MRDEVRTKTFCLYFIPHPSSLLLCKRRWGRRVVECRKACTGAWLPSGKRAGLSGSEAKMKGWEPANANLVTHVGPQPRPRSRLTIARQPGARASLLPSLAKCTARRDAIPADHCNQAIRSDDYGQRVRPWRASIGTAGTARLCKLLCVLRHSYRYSVAAASLLLSVFAWENSM